MVSIPALAAVAFRRSSWRPTFHSARVQAIATNGLVFGEHVVSYVLLTYTNLEAGGVALLSCFGKRDSLQAMYREVSCRRSDA